MHPQAQFLVVTRLKVKPGQVDTVAKMFAKVNQCLLDREPDWQGASFITDLDTDEAAIHAYRSSIESFERFKNSERRKVVDASFAQFMQGPPSVQVNCIIRGEDRSLVWTNKGDARPTWLRVRENTPPEARRSGPTSRA